MHVSLFFFGIGLTETESEAETALKAYKDTWTMKARNSYSKTTPRNSKADAEKKQ